MNYKYRFSIIIPVYNVKDFLRICIDSVIHQTYKNYEIILVDDGSTDSSYTICDEYEKKFQNIRCIHKTNGGLSSARNAGLKACKGEYTIFLDSDDFWIENKFLEDINKKLKNTDVIIFNSFKFYDESTKKDGRFYLDERFYKLNPKDKIKYVVKNNIFKACAWDKVIKTKILIKNNIEFPENKLSEDMQWTGQLLDCINNIDVYDKVIYAYRQRKGSISKNVNRKHIEDIIEQIEIGTQNNKKIILNYFAYEYCILLAYSTKINDKCIKNRIKKLSWILKYDYSKKVKLVRLLYNLVGFEMCRKILYFYIKSR